MIALKQAPNFAGVSAYGVLPIPESFGRDPGARIFWAKSIGWAGPPPDCLGRFPQGAAG